MPVILDSHTRNFMTSRQQNFTHIQLPRTLYFYAIAQCQPFHMWRRFQCSNTSKLQFVFSLLSMTSERSAKTLTYLPWLSNSWVNIFGKTFCPATIKILYICPPRNSSFFVGNFNFVLIFLSVDWTFVSRRVTHFFTTRRKKFGQITTTIAAIISRFNLSRFTVNFLLSSSTYVFRTP